MPEKEKIKEVVLKLFECKRWKDDSPSEIIKDPPFPWEDGKIDENYEYDWDVTEELKEYHSLSRGVIDFEVFAIVQKLVEPFREKYHKLYLNVEYYDDHEWPFVPFILGERFETDEEYNKRVKEKLEKAEKAKKTKEKRKKAKEEQKKERELALYKEIQEKYGLK